MHRLRTTRALFGWTVLMAFLCGLFTPALSQAMAHASAQPASPWMAEICSATGTRHAMLVDDAQTTAPAVPDMSHCDLCCPQHHAALPLQATATPALSLGRERDPYPSLFYHAPRTQHAWSPVQSRGPPSSLS